MYFCVFVLNIVLTHHLHFVLYFYLQHNLLRGCKKDPPPPPGIRVGKNVVGILGLIYLIYIILSILLTVSMTKWRYCYIIVIILFPLSINIRLAMRVHETGQLYCIVVLYFYWKYQIYRANNKHENMKIIYQNIYHCFPCGSSSPILVSPAISILYFLWWRVACFPAIFPLSSNPFPKRSSCHCAFYKWEKYHKCLYTTTSQCTKCCYFAHPCVFRSVTERLVCIYASIKPLKLFLILILVVNQDKLSI